MFSWVSFLCFSRFLFYMTLSFLQSQFSFLFEFRCFRLNWVWSSDKRVDYCWKSKNDWKLKNDWKSKNFCESKYCCESKNCCEELFELFNESSECDRESNNFFEVKSSVVRDFAIFCLIRSFKVLIKICIIMLDLFALRFEKVDVVFFFKKNDFSFSTFKTFNSSIKIVSNWNNSSAIWDQFITFDKIDREMSFLEFRKR
jgi:hypothetical protein